MEMQTALRVTIGRKALTLAAPALCVLATIASLRISWWIIFQGRMGPVVATITSGRGIHTGDILGLCFGALALAFAAGTYASVRQPRRLLALVSTR